MHERQSEDFWICAKIAKRSKLSTRNCNEINATHTHIHILYCQLINLEAPHDKENKRNKYQFPRF